MIDYRWELESSHSKCKRRGGPTGSWSQGHVLLSALFFCFTLGACTPASPPPVIGYIDSAQVMRQYHGTQARRQLIEQQARGWQRSLDSLIAAQRAPAGDEPRSVTRYRADLQQRVLTAGQQADQELLREVNLFLKEYGKANNYDFIFGANESGNIVYANSAKNLTAEVVRNLNQHYDQRHPGQRVSK